MSKYKRLALVDPRLLLTNNLEHKIAKTLSDPIASHTPKERVAANASLQPHVALLEVLMEARRELNAVLNDDEAPLNQRTADYSNALNRIQVFMKKHKLQTTERRERGTYKNTLIQHHDPLMERLLKAVPVNYRAKTKRLYTFLKGHSNIKWDKHGKIISMDGSPLLGGDIVELLEDISRERKKKLTRPIGAPQIQKLLSRINPRFDLVKNPLYHKPIYDGTPRPLPESHTGMSEEEERDIIEQDNEEGYLQRDKVTEWVI